MTYCFSILNEDRFFILRADGSQVLVDVIGGELHPNSPLTEEEADYFKLNHEHKKKPIIGGKSYTVPSRGNGIVL